MHSKKVQLGGTEYTIQELPARHNATWRRGLEAQLGPILNLVEQAGGGLEIASSEDLMRVANSLGRVLVQAPDLLIELLFAYAPNLDAEREIILDRAYDSELVAAFMAVLGLAYPFGGWAQKVASLASGSTASASPTTSKSSPSPNGATPAKALTS